MYYPYRVNCPVVSAGLLAIIMFVKDSDSLAVSGWLIIGGQWFVVTALAGIFETGFHHSA